MNLLVDILLYGAIGFGEWWLAIRRLSAMIDLQIYLAPALVIIESLLGYYVINRFITDNDWVIVVSASVGAGLGTYVELLRRKKMKATNERP
jgi:hypothetical protein